MAKDGPIPKKETANDFINQFMELSINLIFSWLFHSLSDCVGSGLSKKLTEV